MSSFINYFDAVSLVKFESFSLAPRARGDQIKFRALFTALSRQIGMFSFSQLGSVFNKHHATIIHYEKKHEELWDNDDGYALIYMDLEENIRKLIAEKSDGEN